MASMGTNPEAYNRVKAAEPETALSLYFIRRMILRGRNPHKRSGNKVLLNTDAQHSPAVSADGTIRCVNL